MKKLLPVLLAAACSTAPPSPAPAPTATATSSASLAPARAEPVEVAPTASASAAPDAGPAADPEQISAASAETTLFLSSAQLPPAAADCPKEGREARIACLLKLRFEGDPEAADAAIALFTETGDIAGVLPEQMMEGGFRGTIHLVPEVPMGKFKRHLLWILEASRDFDTFFAGITKAAPNKLHYRHTKLAYHFFRSVGRTTPSAYAEPWGVAYNVSGSLNGSATSVRETMFHEVFHVNDADHGDWSVHALRSIFDAIVDKCGTRVPCLKPYAPGDTMVRGGTYYAFQPNNGESVHEYAAELASRYYREHRAVLRGERLPSPPFKCGPDENRRAWDAIGREFFGGTDLTPACPR